MRGVDLYALEARSTIERCGIEDDELRAHHSVDDVP